MTNEKSVRERVFEAAEAIWAERNRSSLPNADEVRERAGTAMNKTAPLVREWKSEKRKTPTLPEEDLPAEVRDAGVDLARTIWTAARRRSRQEFDLERAEWNAEREDAAGVLAEVSGLYDAKSAEADDLAQRNAAFKAAVAERDARITDLEQRLAAEAGARVAAEARAEHAESLNALFKDQLVVGQERISHALEEMSKRRKPAVRRAARSSSADASDTPVGSGGFVQLKLHDN